MRVCVLVLKSIVPLKQVLAVIKYSPYAEGDVACFSLFLCVLLWYPDGKINVVVQTLKMSYVSLTCARKAKKENVLDMF